MTSLAFAAMTVGLIVALNRMKKLPQERATLRRVQLLAFVLGLVMLFTLTVALESFARIWDPSYVYDGS